MNKFNIAAISDVYKAPAGPFSGKTAAKYSDSRHAQNKISTSTTFAPAFCNWRRLLPWPGCPARHMATHFLVMRQKEEPASRWDIVCHPVYLRHQDEGGSGGFPVVKLAAPQPCVPPAPHKAPNLYRADFDCPLETERSSSPMLR